MCGRRKGREGILLASHMFFLVLASDIPSVHSTLAPKKYIMKREVAPESVDRKEHSCWLARTFMKEKIMGEPTEVLSPAPVRWPAA